ncbi:MAG: hypothetical protein M0Z69_00475 [Actinomycetota bacterium]|nr:hypothetical protein [Actinomycetota bacterium]
MRKLDVSPIDPRSAAPGFLMGAALPPLIRADRDEWPDLMIERGSGRLQSGLVVRLGRVPIASGATLLAQVIVSAMLCRAVFFPCHRLMRRRWDPVAVFGA